MIGIQGKIMLREKNPCSVDNKLTHKCTNNDETNLAVNGTMDTGCSLG